MLTDVLAYMHNLQRTIAAVPDGSGNEEREPDILCQWQPGGIVFARSWLNDVY